MKNVINDLMNDVYFICQDYVYEVEGKIKSIISDLEKLVDLEKSFDKKSNIYVEDAVNVLNDKKRESLYNDFERTIAKANESLNIEKDHLAMVLINLSKNYNEAEEIEKLIGYVAFNKEIIQNIRSAFQESTSYVKFLQDAYDDRLNKNKLVEIKKNIKDTVEFMNSFYNNQYQKLLKIEEETRNLKPSSKR